MVSVKALETLVLVYFVSLCSQNCMVVMDCMGVLYVVYWLFYFFLFLFFKLDFESVLKFDWLIYCLEKSLILELSQSDWENVSYDQTEELLALKSLIYYTLRKKLCCFSRDDFLHLLMCVSPLIPKPIISDHFLSQCKARGNGNIPLMC